MKRNIHKYSIISKSEILDFVENAKFIRSDNHAAFKTDFFSLLKGRYNGVPILERYTCGDKQKMSKCIHWFGIDPIENTTKGSHGQYNYINYRINSVIFSLLSNSTLKSISTLDGETGFSFFDEDNNDIIKFDNNRFEEVNPLMFDGELTHMALEGSVYVKWEHSADETKKKAAEFVSAIVDQRYEDFKIYKTTDCWSGYILGFFIAYFIFDEKNGEFWIFSKDDYD